MQKHVTSDDEDEYLPKDFLDLAFKNAPASRCWASLY